MKKIKILGAGISGLSAAINLAKANYDVEVYEKNADCGQRFHGDMQGIENWSKTTDAIADLTEMNIKINFDCTPFSDLVLTNGKNDEKFDFDRPLFYLVKRGDADGSLDQGLKKQALDAGVKIHFNATIRPEKVDIVATGPQSGHVSVADKGIVFETKMADIAVAIINNEFAYKGYSYLLVVNGYACLCTCVFGETEKLTECFNKTKEYFIKKYRLEISDAKPVGGIGYFTINNVWQRDKSRYVGEAAGLQDFLAGFGMRTAFRSGYLAAQAIIENGDYAKLIEKEFRRYLKAGIVNRYVWEHINVGSHLHIAKQFNNVFRSIVKMRSAYNFNIIQRIKYSQACNYIKDEYTQVV